MRTYLGVLCKVLCEFFFSSNTECWRDFNSKQLSCQKFLQNPFLGCQWSPWRGKIIWSAVESFYLMIWTKFQWRNLQSIRKLLRENCFLKILCSGFYCTVDVFAIFSPVFSLRIFYKKHAKNHTSNKPRAFKICVQLSFDKLIWYTKFHKDWSTRRQKHHWSKFFDGLVKYRTENRKTVHCVLYR